MELARAAHQEALADMQPRPERRPTRFPELPAPYTPRDSTFGHLFAQLSRCVRQTILLEARLAAGTLDHPNPSPAPRAEPAPPPPPPGPPRAPTDRPSLRPESLEDETRADANRSPEEILTGICTQLGAAMQAGLAPTENPTPEPGIGRTAPKPRPPPPLTAFERSVEQAIQSGIPPPRGWR